MTCRAGSVVIAVLLTCVACGRGRAAEQPGWYEIARTPGIEAYLDTAPLALSEKATGEPASGSASITYSPTSRVRTPTLSSRPPKRGRTLIAPGGGRAGWNFECKLWAARSPSAYRRPIPLGPQSTRIR